MASFFTKKEKTFPFLDCQKEPQQQQPYFFAIEVAHKVKNVFGRGLIFNLKPLMIVSLAVGVRRVAVPLARHQDREQQPVRPRQHKPQGVQEGPEAGKKI